MQYGYILKYRSKSSLMVCSITFLNKEWCWIGENLIFVRDNKTEQEW